MLYVGRNWLPWGLDTRNIIKTKFKMTDGSHIENDYIMIILKVEVKCQQNLIISRDTHWYKVRSVYNQISTHFVIYGNFRWMLKFFGDHHWENMHCTGGMLMLSTYPPSDRVHNVVCMLKNEGWASKCIRTQTWAMVLCACYKWRKFHSLKLMTHDG